MRSTFVVLLVVVAPAVQAGPACYEEASSRYNIPVQVLRAIAHQESGERDGIEHRNGDGSVDYGRMQINSTHLAQLGAYGIDKRKLRDDACINIQTGAWILSRNAAALGWNWNAIGAYNVGCARLPKGECARRRTEYAHLIDRALKRAPENPKLALASLQKSPRMLMSIEISGGDQ